MRGLAWFIVRRALFSIAVVFGVATITFVISRVVVPDPAAAWAGAHPTAAVLASIRADFHINDPIYVQYYYYLSDLSHGNWGTSPLTGAPVLRSILLFLPNTIELATVAFVGIVIGGIILGVIGATYHNRLQDHFARLVSLVGAASPSFLVCLLVQLVFFYYLGVFPDSGGEISVFLKSPPHITGMLIVDSLLTGNLPALESTIDHMIMPAFCLAFLSLGLTSRLVRSAMLEVLSSDYIRTAKAKGVKRRSVIFKHALKNAMIQPVTVLGITFAGLLGGSVVVESIFSWPGVGRFAAQAALTFDLPDVMGVTLIFTIGVVVANLIADIVSAALDPRIKIG